MKSLSLSPRPVDTAVESSFSWARSAGRPGGEPEQSSSVHIQFIRPHSNSCDLLWMKPCTKVCYVRLVLETFLLIKKI